MGFSGAISTQIYVHGVKCQNNTGVILLLGMVILLLGMVPSAVALAVMFIMKPANVVADKKLKCFYSFLYTALALAVVLIIMIVVGKALGYTPVNISTWNILGRMVAGFRSEFLLEKYEFPRPLMFTTILLVIARVGLVFIKFSRPGLQYVAQWPKSLRSCLVHGLHFINRKWREGENKVLKHLITSCGYMDLKEASLLAKNVGKGRWSVAFILFLIMFPAEGAFMRGMYSETLSAQTISDDDINQYVTVVPSAHCASQTVVHSGHGASQKIVAEGDRNHYTKITAATMEEGEVKNRKLLKSREPRKAKPDVGQPAQHN